MPFSQQFFAIFFNQILNPIQFNTTKTTTFLQTQRIEPEFGGAPVAFDLDVWRFVRSPA